MKKILIIISVAATLISCGGKEKTVDEIVASNNLEEINAKKNELTTKQNAILDEIEKLDIVIANLDSSLSIPVVTTIEAKVTTFKQYVEIQGNVQTKENIVIYPEYAGVLTRVLVKEGQFVNKGEVLAKIDDGGLNQQLSQMETQLALAKTTFERQERLWKDKIGSEIQFLQAKANYEAQQKAVNQMKEQLAKTTITAPFSGVIDDVMSEQGQVVSPGMNQLFRLINLSDMFIEAEIPENYITNIRNGSKVNVYFPVLNDTISSTIRQVGNYINPNNRTFKIEIAITNENKMVKPNMTALLSINNYVNDSALVLPQSIISENAEGEKYIYAVKKGKKNRNYAEKRVIKIGKTQNGVAEIKEGIANGDIIIEEGSRTVKEEEQVLIKKM
ncbi:MAG: efflux RND transporter periplasmic adaptor subunit [Flavobacteriales bacterium]|nr:efflux RND transporter periplasmic adaptor subunit [Flavobacteriales bacterium]MCW8913925.1 efflux RND transporter periplasmic adaptor subunit [Flavobacteriales bacterium]MCW8937275.1 efflux RND transporter periplasmic adaptor subunit [Flavobacteriales bacterium]MCW8940907.1 efflux RND transporter periplasmic adaptor subunit [Flavobacteriales bacterium]MCW8967209.1 efflux RND transporter periplasmic adaptor subunit [Flavobacteriales bacterium]